MHKGSGTDGVYHKLGCVPVIEPDQKLIDEDPNDVQLEYDIQITLELEVLV